MNLSILTAAGTVAAALLFFPSCSHEQSHSHVHSDGTVHEGSHEDAAPAAVAAPAPSADAAVYAVRCGCAIEAVGACGEYVEVDGSFVALELPVDMGAMPFCGKEGLKAKLDGELADETFVATTFAYAD